MTGPVHVVDDDDAVRDSLRFVLELEGLAVRTYADAHALLAADLPPAGCVVTDFHMPGETDGAEVAAHLRILHPALPVIIASGRPDVLARSWDPELGYRFLGKPYLPRHLLAMLRDVLPAA